MLGRLKALAPVAAVVVAFFAAAGAAQAQCCAPPPPCCQPPPPPPPPTPGPCCSGHTVVVPGVNVNVSSTAIAISGASARAQAGAGAGGAVFIGGGGSWYVEQPTPSVIGGLNVEVEAEAKAQVKTVAYQATRKVSKRVVIQAVCIDDRLVPHPASQVRPDREIWDEYEGELYRCIAGTRLQIVWAEWKGEVRFDGGETIDCRKGEALWFAHGEIGCRTQKPERDCNERSLLRRYGAGVKIFTLYREETYTAYREETVTSAEASAKASASMSIMLDGGVGGVVH